MPAYEYRTSGVPLASSQVKSIYLGNKKKCLQYQIEKK